MTFCVAVHHKGSLVKVPKLHYSGGETHVFNDLDVDIWSYFKAIRYVKDLGHKEKVKLWWKSKYGSFQKDLKELKNDADVGGTTAEPGGELSRVDMPRVAVEDINMVEDGYSNDDSTKDVHFDDSEEERVGMKMKSVVEEQCKKRTSRGIKRPSQQVINDAGPSQQTNNDAGPSQQTNNDVGPSQQSRVDDSGPSHQVPVTETFVPPNVNGGSHPTNVAPATAGEGQPTNVAPAAGEGQVINVEPPTTVVIAKQPRPRGRPKATVASKTGTTATASTSKCVTTSF
ncbi:hypothetical protein SESBI_35637 [Sesbania bispinosa]|nr:hypothetical protein SESBI_35637 [Sesbania bispinosa]